MSKPQGLRIFRATTGTLVTITRSRELSLPEKIYTLLSVSKWILWGKSDA